MTDYRRLQRTLFRMQLDPAFAEAVLAGREAAGLAEPERALLARADLPGILADSGGKRRGQILGNAASEYVLALAEAARIGAGAGVLDGFAASDELHRAISAEEPLPLAFGAWLRRSAERLSSGVFAALAHLEAAMARARREFCKEPRLEPGEIALSPRASLVTLPEGAFDHAQALRAALDAGGAAPAPPEALQADASRWLSGAWRDPQNLETVLLVVSAEPASHCLREVTPERLEQDVARLLHAATTPLDARALAALSEERQWKPDEVREFVNGLVADGVLSGG